MDVPTEVEEPELDYLSLVPQVTCPIYGHLTYLSWWVKTRPYSGLQLRLPPGSGRQSVRLDPARPRRVGGWTDCRSGPRRGGSLEV